MSYDPNKSNSTLDIIAHSKNIITGILVVLSLIGAAYGSFKPEGEAREAYEVLAPDVDMAIEQADANAAYMSQLEGRIMKLEAENRILEGLMIGYLTAQGHYVAPETPKKRVKKGGDKKAEQKPAPILMAPEDLFDEIEEQAPVPEQHQAPLKRRKRSAPSWKK